MGKGRFSTKCTNSVPLNFSWKVASKKFTKKKRILNLFQLFSFIKSSHFYFNYLGTRDMWLRLWERSKKSFVKIISFLSSDNSQCSRMQLPWRFGRGLWWIIKKFDFCRSVEFVSARRVMLVNGYMKGFLQVNYYCISKRYALRMQWWWVSDSTRGEMQGNKWQVFVRN